MPERSRREYAIDSLKRGVGSKDVKAGEEPTEEQIAKRESRMQVREAKNKRYAERQNVKRASKEKADAEAKALKDLEDDFRHSNRYIGAEVFVKHFPAISEQFHKLSEIEPYKALTMVQEAIAWAQIDIVTDKRREAATEEELAAYSTTDALTKAWNEGGRPGLGKGRKMSLEKFVEQHFKTFESMVTPRVKEIVMREIKSIAENTGLFRRENPKNKAKRIAAHEEKIRLLSSLITAEQKAAA